MSTVNQRLQVSSQWREDDIAVRYAIGERLTINFAHVMVKNTSIVNYKGEANVLDFACGTGAVTAALYAALPKEKWSQVKVLGGDISEPMLEFLKERGEKEGWTGLETAVFDGTDIKLPPSTFTHLYVNFAIFVMPPTTVSSCYNLLQPGGRIGISSWINQPWYHSVAQAVSRLPEPRPVMPTSADVMRMIGGGRPWDQTNYVEEILKESGFTDVEIETRTVTVDCGTPKQYVGITAMALGLIASFWDEGTRQELMKKILAELEKFVEEETGGKEKSYFLTFTELLGQGGSPSNSPDYAASSLRSGSRHSVGLVLEDWMTDLRGDGTVSGQPQLKITSAAKVR